MILKTISTGSKDGNCYALIDSKGKILLLDAGANIKAIKQGINFRLSDIKGFVVTHKHGDHSASEKALLNIGLHGITPLGLESLEWPSQMRVVYGDYICTAFAIRNSDGEFCHTDNDGSECPIYGYLIKHPEIGTLVYMTDIMYCKYRFPNVNHLLLGVDYAEDLVVTDELKSFHVLTGHMSIDTACGIIEANNSHELKSVTLGHLSERSADPESFFELASEKCSCPVYIAKKGMEIEL